MKTNLIAGTLLLTILLNGFGIDIYVPSLPVMKNWFHTTSELVQWTVGCYLLGFASIQLFIGSICDSIGRRKPYFCSLILYAMLSWIVAQTDDITSLLILRFLQGLAVGTYTVACRAMLVDLFQGKKLEAMSNYVLIAYAIGPIIAPTIGGYLQHYFGWQMNFIFLSGYALVCFVLAAFCLPETLKIKQPLSFHHWFHSSKTVLSHVEFWLISLITGSIYSLLILFNVVAPFLIEEVMHYSVVAYGYVALVMGLAWFLGTSTGRMLQNVEKRKRIKSGLLMMLFGGVTLLLLSLKTLNLLALVIPMCLILYCGGIVLSTYYAQGMAIFPSAMAATAGAFMGVIVLIIASVFGSFLGAQLKSTTMTPLAGMILFLLMSCGLLSIIAKKYYEKNKVD